MPLARFSLRHGSASVSGVVADFCTTLIISTGLHTLCTWCKCAEMGSGKSSLVLRFVKSQFFDFQVRSSPCFCSALTMPLRASRRLPLLDDVA